MRFATIYMPDFPVWAVEFFEPSLRGKDLLVQLSGQVAARSERLRTEGIERGWAIERARTQAPDAVVRAHPGARTRLAWEVILKALDARTPWLEPCVTGEFVHRAGDRETRRTVDALADEGLAVIGLDDADAAAAARSIDPHALARGLRARVGVAGDRATSFLAALCAPAEAALVVSSGEEAAFRDRVSLRTLGAAGISDETRERLGWLGFRAVGELRRLTPAQLQAQFPEGRALHALSRGGDIRPVLLFVPPPSIRKEHLAFLPLEEPAAWEPMVMHLLMQAMADLGNRDAQMVTVSLGCGRQRRTSRRLCHEPSSDPRTLAILTRMALADIAESFPDGVDTFVVALEGLVPAATHQELLWEEERAAFARALKALEKRLPGMSLRVVGLDADAYLPEEAFQLLSTASPAPPSRPARRAAARRQAMAPPPRPGAARAEWEAARVQEAWAAKRTVASREAARMQEALAAKRSGDASWEAARVQGRAAPLPAPPPGGRLKRSGKRSNTGHVRHDGYALDEPGLL